jgi:2-isopropylmalate synthase
LRYEDLGYSLDASELDAAYRRFTEVADRKKRIYDQDLISLIVDRDGEGWARSAAA